MTRRWVILTLALASCTDELDLGTPPDRLRPGTAELTVGLGSPWGAFFGGRGWCGSTVCLAASSEGGRLLVRRYARPSGELLDATPIVSAPADGCGHRNHDLEGASSGDDFFLATYGLGALVSGADGSVRSYDLPEGLCGGGSVVADGDRWIMAGYDPHAGALRVASMPRDGGAWTELVDAWIPAPSSPLRAVDTGTARFLVWSDAECVRLAPIAGGSARCVATGRLGAAVGVDGVIAMAVRSSTDGTARIGSSSPATGRFEGTACVGSCGDRFVALGTGGYLDVAGGREVTRRHPDGRAVEAAVGVETCSLYGCANPDDTAVLPLSQDQLFMIFPCGVERYLTYR